MAAQASFAVSTPRRPALLKRLASTLVLLPIFLLIVIKAPGWMFNGLVIIASATALWELMRLFEQGGRPTYRWLGVLSGTAVTAAFGASRLLDHPLVLPAFTVTLVAGLVLSVAVWQGAPATEQAANTLLGVIYVGWLLGFGILLYHTSPIGAELVIFLVAVTWIGETTAYVVGSAIGRHKLAPVISPRKTIEGAVAQVIASVLSAAAFGAWLLPQCGIGMALAGGALLGVVAQAGDLAESAIKRSVGTKDAGELIPGHGGVLDRIDSLLFNLPTFYYFTLATGCR
jgi:phosphatidate cytidylyltransferase